jgi:hypothetical protein
LYVPGERIAACEGDHHVLPGGSEHTPRVSDKRLRRYFNQSVRITWITEWIKTCLGISSAPGDLSFFGVDEGEAVVWVLILVAQIYLTK